MALLSLACMIGDIGGNGDIAGAAGLTGDAFGAIGAGEGEL